MKTKIIMPPSGALIAILIMVALNFLFPIAPILPPMWALLGIIPLVFGVIINLAADGAFHHAHTTVTPFAESSALVTSGVFRITRNPMYLGFTSLLLGIGILLGSLSPFLVIILYLIWVQTKFIKVEERMLASKFGVEWQKYTQTTRRWL
jgi:protein-S-isoprenylcysteine O-methyltransferase Ste14